MDTHCTPELFEFQGVGRRQVVARFDGGMLSSNGGALLLGEVERRRGIVRRFSECFYDDRSPEFTEHSVFELAAQRIFALALGDEDLNDHDELCRDQLLATVIGKKDPRGESRRSSRDRGKPLAGSSTLGRFERGAAGRSPDDRYRKITVDTEAVDRFFVETFIQSWEHPPNRLVIDLDATDDPLHGAQEGRHFHGYYRCYCYLPLYIFCGRHLLCARLRPSSMGASRGVADEVARIVSQLRAAWPDVEIIIRGDSDYSTEELMAWCEQNGVDYVFGLKRNPRLEREIEKQLERVRKRFQKTGSPQREYKDFWHSTLDSWSRRRRVIGKAEHLAKGRNPRFIVTPRRSPSFPDC